MVLMFLIGLPIAYYAAKYGVDIDLLTRGAGFGYLGSTLTSLIYASFTFLLFSIEASILSVALQMLFGIPLAMAHVHQLAGRDSDRGLRHQPDQPHAARDAADLAGAAVPADPLHRLQASGDDLRPGRTTPVRSGGGGIDQLPACSAWPPRCCSRCCRRSASRSTTCAFCPSASTGRPSAGGRRCSRPVRAGC